MNETIQKHGKYK